MIVLGLTGSAAMGKSTTAKFFAEENVPVFDADAVVHRLYRGEAAPLIEREFPGTTEAGKVNRDKLSASVLGKPDALKKLESLIHPLVRDARARFLRDMRKMDADIVVFDIPLLFETGADKEVDAVVVVTAPVELQRERMFQRSGMTEEKYTAILSRQMPDSEKRSRADFLVDSSRGLEDARKQVRDILHRLREQGIPQKKKVLT
jgi:dephospho-CoA kinase